jgi:oligoendopeptidase F
MYGIRNTDGTPCRLRCSRAVLGFVCWLFTSQVFTAPEPSSTSAPGYHIDLARYFFASPQVEIAERAKLFAKVAELESLKGCITSSADHLLRSLQLADAIQVDLRKHSDYLYLRRALNTRDSVSRRGSATLNAEVPARIAFFEREVASLKDGAWLAMLAQKPDLKPYVYAIQKIRRYQSHILPAGEEEIVRGLRLASSSWQYQLYQELQDRTGFGTVDDRGRQLDVRKERAAIALNPDRAVREAGFKKRYAGFARQRDLYAFTLLHLASARNRLAQLHHHDDAAAEAYFQSEWQPTDVTALLQAVKQHASLYKRYQKLRANHARKFVADRDVNIWDLSLHGRSYQTPRFPFDEAVTKIRAAAAPLGPDFSRELTLLLDPANGRLDVAPSENRYSGGFSLGFIGTPSVFFGGVFEGRYNDMRVMAHEATHAVHRQLMTNAKVMPCYATGPNYLFESFAVFTELLLANCLYEQEPNPAARQYFLEQFLEGKGTVMFVAGPEAELEQAIYAGEKTGTVNGADDLDALTRRIYSQYSIWPDRHEELKGQWMMIPLMYEDPFYDINYVYAGLLGLTYLNLYQSDPKLFVPRYVAMLKNGFDAPAAELLNRFLDLDIRDPSFVNRAMATVRKQVERLMESYAADDR